MSKPAKSLTCERGERAETPLRSLQTRPLGGFAVAPIFQTSGDRRLSCFCASAASDTIRRGEREDYDPAEAQLFKVGVL